MIRCQMTQTNTVKTSKIFVIHNQKIGVPVDQEGLDILPIPFMLNDQNNIPTDSDASNPAIVKDRLLVYFIFPQNKAFGSYDHEHTLHQVNINSVNLRTEEVCAICTKQTNC